LKKDLEEIRKKKKKRECVCVKGTALSIFKNEGADSSIQIITFFFLTKSYKQYYWLSILKSLKNGRSWLETLEWRFTFYTLVFIFFKTATACFILFFLKKINKLFFFFLGRFTFLFLEYNSNFFYFYWSLVLFFWSIDVLNYI
jgi:hypothetical protein